MAIAQILVVDDEPHVVKLVRANLEVAGYGVISATDGRGVVSLVEAQEPDLVILDIMLPGMDGYEIARRIREFSSVPILMLTARGSEMDLVHGFDMGADDYLVKPFAVNELLVRVRALIKRSKLAQDIVRRPPLVSGNLTIDYGRRSVSLAGRELQLSPTEYAVLTKLAANANRVVLHEELLREVWGSEYRSETQYLRTYIHHLRQKIEENPAQPTRIITHPGAGYMFRAADS